MGVSISVVLKKKSHVGWNEKLFFAGKNVILMVNPNDN